MTLASAGTATADDDWVLAKPGPETQYQKSVAERGGVNPCLTDDPGFGTYRSWAKIAPGAQLLVPRQLPSHGRVDVMIHFHGHEAARKEWVQAMQRPAFVGVDLGNGSQPYHDQFLDPDAFERLLRQTEKELSDGAMRHVEIRRVGLSAWSAGYGAIQEILTQPLGKKAVDVVILLDGLHAGYAGRGLNSVQLAPFVEFAQRAGAGNKLMFVSHSSIIPPGYASTTETANYLIDQLGGKPRPSRPRSSDPMGLDLIDYYVQKGFHVRGFAGHGKLDHCAHLGLFRDVLRYHVRRRWR
jgi:hypothetical protein